jgi:ethanolamine permease
MNDLPRGVRYDSVDPSYLEARGLRRYARVLHLWALGVGAVISGEFYGWNFGLEAGGFVGLLGATAVITVMYFGLVYSIAEMSAALPHAGAAYSFARSAMGPWGGYVTGLAENMEYILTPAVVVVGIGGYLTTLVPAVPPPAWWALAYLVFTGLNVWGVEISFRFTVLITLVAIAVLGLFYVAALPHLDIARWALAVEPSPGHGRLLPRGLFGILAALPFAIWFFLAIEELPLAAEESADPRRDIPRGIVLGMVTLTVLAFLVLLTNSAIAPGAAVIGKSAAPLNDGFKTLFGEGAVEILTLAALAGLVASFHTIIFAFARQIYSLSRAGYFPRVFSLTHPERRTPHVALITGSTIGYVVALVIYLLPSDSTVGATLLNMAVFGAVISYGLQMASFVLLRVRRPDIPRPYRSPFGMAGAVVAGVIAAVTFATLFLVEAYRPVIIGVAVWYVLGLLYFYLFGRHHLVAQAPEEAFALGREAPPA